MLIIMNYLDLDKIKYRIDRIKRHDFSQMTLTMLEAFLNKEFADIAQLCLINNKQYPEHRLERKEDHYLLIFNDVIMARFFIVSPVGFVLNNPNKIANLIKDWYVNSFQDDNNG